MWTYLVSVSPEEVLCADVHERVLDALLERRSVGNVLPVVVPQTPSVDAGDAKGGDDNATRGNFGQSAAQGFMTELVLLDGELAPCVCEEVPN
jgi:hypothetical protein